MLLFDEADAIFGKRSEVRDAHDGTPTSRARTCCSGWRPSTGWPCWPPTCGPPGRGVHAAAGHRVDFPVPDEAARTGTVGTLPWPARARAADVDLDFLATSFELAGGHIRSAAITAAYLAAEAGQPVGMAQLVGAVGREYRKLGRLTLESEFGRYLELAH